MNLDRHEVFQMYPCVPVHPTIDEQATVEIVYCRESQFLSFASIQSPSTGNICLAAEVVEYVLLSVDVFV